MKTPCLNFTFLLLISGVTLAEVVPDGTTNTTITANDKGVPRVNIAPRNSDLISHNKYTRFDVDRIGLELNNTEHRAQTIINEVTSVHPSTLAGEIKILGTPAHIIIANPNGIYVDGASFVKTASLALAAGKVTYQQRTKTNGDIQQYPVITSSDLGFVDVETGGLSSVLNRLDIIARNISIKGKVENTEENHFASVNLIAGKTSTEFNPNLTISSLAGNWYVNSPINSEGTKEYAIDITRSSSVMANSLNLMVTDKGAGVRLSGNAVAGKNQFEISADGRVTVSGVARSAGHLKVIADRVELESVNNEAAIVESQSGALTINAKNLINKGGLLSGSVKNDADADSKAGVSLNIAEAFSNITNSALENERSIVFSQSDLYISANSFINQAGKVLANTGLNILSVDFKNSIDQPDFLGRGEVSYREYVGKRIWYTGFLLRERIRETRVNFGEPLSKRIASEIIANSGDVTINVETFESKGGDFTLNNGDLNITADTVYNESVLAGFAKLQISCAVGSCDRTGRSNVDTIGGKWQASGDINITAQETIKNVGGVFLAIKDLKLEAKTITSDSVKSYDVISRNQGLRGLFLKNDALWVQKDQGGSFLANMGKLIIDSENDVLFDGGSFQAGDGVESNVELKIVREPTQSNLIMRRHSGLLSEWF